MQTLEAVIALMILFGVIIFSISLREPPKQEIPEDIRLTQDAILKGLEFDQRTREFVMASESGANLVAISLYAAILGSVPEGIKMGFVVDDLVFPYKLFINKKNIYADSVILANESGNGVKTFNLYLWHVDDEITNPCPVSNMGVTCTWYFECIDSINATINNETILEEFLDLFELGCDSGNCTIMPYTC